MNSVTRRAGSRWRRIASGASLPGRMKTLEAPTSGAEEIPRTALPVERPPSRRAVARS
ncbi:MAG: hypothetical protein BWY88_01238 [Synergistetes bacterium ADurb.Bin520]|nr:MAG: hypothetical protein BWY88_01238 [Synergistetes bacterium ADurb.Bin520]